MGVFYFTETNTNNVYELSSTSTISVSEPAVTTNYPVEDGSSATDGYYVEGRTVNFSGLITDIKVYGQDEDRARSVSEWIEQIRQLRKDKSLLTVQIHSLSAIPNCMMTTFDINRGVEQGLSGWLCDLSFKEITVSERAKLTTVLVPLDEVKDAVSGKSKEGDSSTVSGKIPLEETIGADLLVEDIKKYNKKNGVTNGT